MISQGKKCTSHVIFEEDEIASLIKQTEIPNKPNGRKRRKHNKEQSHTLNKNHSKVTDDNKKGDNKQ